MDISDAIASNTYSIRQAIGTATLRKVMNQDAQAVDAIMQGMQEATAKTMESSVTPHLGQKIDVRV